MITRPTAVQQIRLYLDELHRPCERPGYRRAGRTRRSQWCRSRPYPACRRRRKSPSASGRSCDVSRGRTGCLNTTNSCAEIYSASVNESLVDSNPVCHSVNRITEERGNGRRPNLAGMGKGWPTPVATSSYYAAWACFVSQPMSDKYALAIDKRMTPFT